MTYKEIIDTFKQKVQGHFFINTFGYGDISDIMTPDNEQPPYYPYIFLNPVSVTSNDRTSTFSFNVICMTQAPMGETNIIRAQSDCMDNLRDLIAKVNYTLDDPLIQFNEPYTFTPFKERFQDDVVGATCAMSITYPSILDGCNTPIADPQYCLVARDFTDRREGAEEFNGTYEFGGWGYWKEVKTEYNSVVYEFVCDTRYGYYIRTESDTYNSQPVYPIMGYIESDITSSFPNAYYTWFSQYGTTFECGAQTETANLGSIRVSYANTTSDNG